jgi:hypothetical protein
MKLIKMLPMLTLFVSCDSEKAITAFNAAPEAVITSHSDGAVVLGGDAVQFRAALTDANHSAEELEAAWYAGGDESCPFLPVDENGNSTCSLVVASGDEEIRVQVRDPENATGIDTITLSITESDAPSAAIISPFDSSTHYSDQKITFSGVAMDSEDPPEDLTVHWYSDLEGQLEIDVLLNSAGIFEAFAYLSEGEHAIQLLVEDSTGQTGSDSVLIDVHPPNTAPTCELTAPPSGSTGAEGDTVLFEGSAEDTDEAAALLSVIWSSDKDGELGSSIPNSDGSIGFSFSDLSADTHTITMRVTDAAEGICTDSIYYTVATLGPVVESIVLAPDPAATSDIVTATASLHSESGGSLSATYEWHVISGTTGVDSTVQSGSSNELDGASHFEKTDQVYAVATPFDGVDYGPSMQSVSIEIVNTPPSAPTTAMDPIGALEGIDDLYCTVMVESTDEDGDMVGYSFIWTDPIGQVLQITPTSSATSDVLSAASTSPGTWMCAAIPNDGEDDGSSGTASLEVLSCDSDGDGYDSEDCGGTDCDDGDATLTESCGSGPVSGSRRVFVTSTNYDGDLGGLAGADQKCQDRADAAGLGGSWKAWLSDSTTHAADRLNQPTGPLLRTDGVAIANSWNDLVSSWPTSAPEVDEFGQAYPLVGSGNTSHCSWSGGYFFHPWTATDSQGQLSGPTCSDWTDTSGVGFVGLGGYSLSQWTYWCDDFPCSWEQPLYCFEQ